MTVREVLNIIAVIQPTSISEDIQRGWLHQLDTELYQNVIATHEGAEAVTPPAPREQMEDDTQLLVGAPYDAIYLHWLQSRIDYTLGEYGRYNNSNALFEADRTAFTNWYNRTHLPLQVKSRYF